MHTRSWYENQENCSAPPRFLCKEEMQSRASRDCSVYYCFPRFSGSTRSTERLSLLFWTFVSQIVGASIHTDGGRKFLKKEPPNDLFEFQHRIDLLVTLTIHFFVPTRPPVHFEQVPLWTTFKQTSSLTFTYEQTIGDTYDEWNNTNIVCHFRKQ